MALSVLLKLSLMKPKNYYQLKQVYRQQVTLLNRLYGHKDFTDRWATVKHLANQQGDLLKHGKKP